MKYWIQILSIVVSLFAAAAFVYHGAGGLRERYLDYGLIISIFVALFSVLLLPFQHVVDKGFRELNKKVDELIERQKREMQNVENSFRRIIDDTEYIEHVAFGGWVHVRRGRALEYDINEMKRMEKMENNKNTFF
ncbi:hypothetical protein EST62_12750 [Chlorobaculum sp. 24CR]|uniref:hypothetical protein n=1 Tax=Chlorobaculum sp. 24CR TaxID=2508878 RepID=UPI00100BC84A|nr:hypothetical protein [Chlorobaculum sp. 24CR]RXK80338.1 hypothetical protein EST62_12750 [Chlorobaculum sp. 24CR]